jgi:hypothetical protein
MKPRYLVIAISAILLQGCSTAPPYRSSGQVAVGSGYSGVNIGINYSSYPELVPIPGHPVYYDPRVNSNYFFYDNLYWVLQGSNWYSSGWYNGPWDRVDYYDMPAYVLRIPVRYYRQPPQYFRGWLVDAPPRWGDHWGRDWEQRRSGWDRWDQGSPPRLAPLPSYQRHYSGDHYPHSAEQQRQIRSENDRYRPRNAEGPRYSQPREPQDQPRRQDPWRHQDQPRPLEPQSRQDPQRQLEQPRYQPEPKGGLRGRRAEPQDPVQTGRDARQEDDWKKKRREERNQGR